MKTSKRSQDEQFLILPPHIQERIDKEGIGLTYADYARRNYKVDIRQVVYQLLSHFNLEIKTTAPKPAKLEIKERT